MIPGSLLTFYTDLECLRTIWKTGAQSMYIYWGALFGQKLPGACTECKRCTSTTSHCMCFLQELCWATTVHHQQQSLELSRISGIKGMPLFYFCSKDNFINTLLMLIPPSGLIEKVCFPSPHYVLHFKVSNTELGHFFCNILAAYFFLMKWTGSYTMGHLYSWAMDSFQHPIQVLMNILFQEEPFGKNSKEMSAWFAKGKKRFSPKQKRTKWSFTTLGRWIDGTTFWRAANR